MITPRELAKSYALLGYRVLATYTVVRNEEGELVCSCWRTKDGKDNCAKSSGKHPHADISPHGSGSATNDVEEIDNWPEGGYNVGIAFNNSFMAIDVDDPKVATAIMDPELGLRDQMYMASTGRAGGGVHVYIRCAEDTSGTDLITTEGKKLGELRGTGEYCVLPPAVHKSGKLYAWLNKSLLTDGEPQLYGKDGYDFADQLFGIVGIHLRTKREAVSVSDLGGAIEQCDLPFAVPPDSLLIHQMMSGTYPSDDRSNTLYTLACKVFRLAALSDVEISDRQVAGFVKKIDANWQHAKGPKFYGRRDADFRYWELAVRASKDTDTVRQQTAADTSNVIAMPGVTLLPPNVTSMVENELEVITETTEAAEPPDDGLPPDDRIRTHYYWTRTQGFCWQPPDKGSKNQNAQRICNFRPQIVEIHEVWDGEERLDDVWVLQLGRLAPIHIKVVARAELRTVMKEINQSLPPEYIIEPEMSDRFWAGIRHYSTVNGAIPRRRSYAATGWIFGEDAFLLPGARGAITANGIDESITYENDTMPTRWYAYGKGVQPQQVDLADTLRKLYGMSLPATTVPLMTQIWAAPLASLGGDRDAALLHLHVRTGSLKTSMLKVAMSVYGQFNTNATYFDPWTSTSNAIQGSWHRLRDLPMVIDDYKAAMMAGRTREISTIVQNYADRTGRTRSSPGQREQVSQRARCLILSSGEDIWEGQESTNARTIVIVPPGASTKEEKDLAYARISPAQSLATTGQLAALGYEWISWLCSKGQVKLRSVIAKLQDKMREEVAKGSLGGVHGRVSASMANLLAMDELFKAFLKERVPSYLAEYREMSRWAWLQTMNMSVENAEEATTNAPFFNMVEEIRSALVSGAGQLVARTDESGTESTGFNGAEIIGFVDHEFVYLNKTITFSWLEKRVRQRGASVTFTWLSFRKDAVSNHDCINHTDPMYMAGARIRVLQIPKHLIITDVIIRIFAP